MEPIIRPAARMARVRYAIRDILVEAEKTKASGMALTLLNIGDPAAVGAFRAPQHLVEAVRKAWADHRYEYAPSAGLPEAREAVAAEWRTRGRPVQAEDVVVTAGLSEAIRFLLAALVDPGDEVLVPAPGYPLYHAVLGEIGGVAREYLLDEERGWALSVPELESALGPRTRALVVINPGNPTGHVADETELRAAADFCRRHGLLLICDEVYDRLAFDVEGPVPSAAAWCGDDVATVTLNGLSKNWLLPGARVGWAVFHNPHRMRDYIGAVHKLANARLCAPAPQQWAVKPALEGSQEHLVSFRAALKERSQAVTEAVRRLPGVSMVAPEGTFYALPRLDLEHPAFQGYRSDTEVVLAWLRATGVLTVPGVGFGQRPGSHHFRIVTLASPAALRDAMASLGNVMFPGVAAPQSPPC